MFAIPSIKTHAPDSCEKCPLYKEEDLVCAKLNLRELSALSSKSGPASMRRGSCFRLDRFAEFPVLAIASGVLGLQPVLVDGQAAPASFYARGAVVDLRGNDRIRGGYLTAVNDVKFCILSPDEFDRIMSTNERARASVRERLVVPLGNEGDRREPATLASVLAKVSAFILEVQRRQITVFSKDKVELPVSQLSLAKYVGLDRKLVADSLRYLRDQEIVEELGEGSARLLIKKPGALRQIAEGNVDLLEEPEKKLSISKVA
ncbi:MAG: helix-turn-helix domain-containing protein [Paracoccaceae bacterium]